MAAETRFTETEALLKAMADSEADSGNTDLTDEYLRREFLPGELRTLAAAADLLSDRATAIYREKRKANAAAPGPLRG